MIDQANRLREVVANKSEYDMASMQPKKKNMEIITVTSGKGGVGKTSFSVNFGIALAERGKKVVIMDADFGLANVDLILGISSKYDITDILSGEKTIEEVMVKGFGGVQFISGGSGLLELLNMSDENFETVISKISDLENYADVLIIDTGAGVSDRIMRMACASDETFVIVTPEPTSIMDAFALIKSLSKQRSAHNVRIVVNRADTLDEANLICENFISVVEKFLGIKIESLGSIIADKAVGKAVINQIPFIISSPSCVAAKQLNAIADKYLNISDQDRPAAQGMAAFIKKLIRKK